MKFILAGKLLAAIEAAKFFKSLNIDIFICPSSGEEKIKAMPSLRSYALQNGLKILESLDELNGEKIFLLSVEFDKIIKKSNFASGSKFYNIHFSLLPKYRGTMTSFWPILFRENHTGVTLHEMDDGIDTGNIIKQLIFEIEEHFTAKDLYFQYHISASELIKFTLKDLIDGNIVFKNQQESLATSFPRFLFNFIPQSFKTSQLKLMEYSDVYNLLRALIFEDFQLPIVDNKKIVKISKYPFDGQNCILPTNSKNLYAQYLEYHEG